MKCQYCNGTGIAPVDVTVGYNSYSSNYSKIEICFHCKGTGELEDKASGYSALILCLQKQIDELSEVVDALKQSNDALKEEVGSLKSAAAIDIASKESDVYQKLVAERLGRGDYLLKVDKENWETRITDLGGRDLREPLIKDIIE